MSRSASPRAPAAGQRVRWNRQPERAEHDRAKRDQDRSSSEYSGTEKSTGALEGRRAAAQTDRPGPIPDLAPLRSALQLGLVRGAVWISDPAAAAPSRPVRRRGHDQRGGDMPPQKPSAPEKRSVSRERDMRPACRTRHGRNSRSASRRSMIDSPDATRTRCAGKTGQE